MRKRHCTNQQKTSFGIPSGSVRDSLDHRSIFDRSSLHLRSTFVRTSLDHRSDIVRTSFAKPEVTKEEAWWFGWQPSSERRQRKPVFCNHPQTCRTTVHHVEYVSCPTAMTEMQSIMRKATWRICCDIPLCASAGQYDADGKAVLFAFIV